MPFSTSSRNTEFFNEGSLKFCMRVFLPERATYTRTPKQSQPNNESRGALRQLMEFALTNSFAHAIIAVSMSRALWPRDARINVTWCLIICHRIARVSLGFPCSKSVPLMPTCWQRSESGHIAQEGNQSLTSTYLNRRPNSTAIFEFWIRSNFGTGRVAVTFRMSTLPGTMMLKTCNNVTPSLNHTSKLAITKLTEVTSGEGGMNGCGEMRP